MKRLLFVFLFLLSLNSFAGVQLGPITGGTNSGGGGGATNGIQMLNGTGTNTYLFGPLLDTTTLSNTTFVVGNTTFRSGGKIFIRPDTGVPLIVNQPLVQQTSDIMLWQSNDNSTVYGRIASNGVLYSSVPMFQPTNNLLTSSATNVATLADITNATLPFSAIAGNFLSAPGVGQTNNGQNLTNTGPINIRFFGNVGTADDTATVQAAAYYGGAVYFDPNTIYTVTNTIQMTNNSVFIGQNSIFRLAGGYDGSLFNTSTNLTNWGFSGIIADGQRIGFTNISGTQAWNYDPLNNSNIFTSTIHKRTGFTLCGTAHNSFFVNCSALWFSDTGARIVGGLGDGFIPTNSTLYINGFRGINSYCGLWTTNGAEYLTLNNIQGYGCGYGMIKGSANNYLVNGNFDSCGCGYRVTGLGGLNAAHGANINVTVNHCGIWAMIDNFNNGEMWENFRAMVGNSSYPGLLLMTNTGGNKFIGGLITSSQPGTMIVVDSGANTANGSNYFIGVDGVGNTANSAYATVPYFTPNSGIMKVDNTYIGSASNLVNGASITYSGIVGFATNNNFQANAFPITNGMSAISSGTNGELVIIYSALGSTVSNKVVFSAGSSSVSFPAAISVGASINANGNANVANVRTLNNGAVMFGSNGQLESSSTSNTLSLNAAGNGFADHYMAAGIATNGFASKAINSPIRIQGSGITNSLGVNGTAFITCTTTTFTNFNNAGTAYFTNSSATLLGMPFPLQNNGFIKTANAGTMDGWLVPW